MDKKQLQKWIKTQQTEQEKLKQERFKEKGYEKLLILPIGETKVDFDLENREIREVKTEFGERIILPVVVNGEIYDWMISKQSSLLINLLKALENGIQTIIVVRSGTGKQTRYSLK